MHSKLPRLLGVLGAGTATFILCDARGRNGPYGLHTEYFIVHKTYKILSDDKPGVAGQMGAGIAQLAAMKGLDVILCDMHSAAVERSIAATNRSLSKMVSKQQLTQEQADSAASRIRRATDMQVMHLIASVDCLMAS